MTDDGYGYYDVGGGFGDSDEEGGPEHAVTDEGAQQRKAHVSGEDRWVITVMRHSAVACISSSSCFPALQRERMREAAKEKTKLDSELGKIRSIMEQKGHAHANAFEKRSRNRSNKVGPSDGQPSNGQKKRRI